jgi:hypothetical protein
MKLDLFFDREVCDRISDRCLQLEERLSVSCMRLMENETRRDLNPSEGYKHLRKNFPTKSTIVPPGANLMFPGGALPQK